MGYTKLFSSLVASSVWSEDNATRIVWITMLALKDERHRVIASVPGLARMAVLARAEVEKALKKLSSPDPDSQDKTNGGRRIQALPDGGWLVLNGEKYRKLLSAEDRREYQRNYKRQMRQRLKTAPDGREQRFTKAYEAGDHDECDRLTDPTI